MTANLQLGPIVLRPDGRGVWVERRLFGADAIVVGPVGCVGYDDEWMYLSSEQAILAALTWAPDAADPPDGWVRHKPSNRRRPGGDPAAQYVAT